MATRVPVVIGANNNIRKIEAGNTIDPTYLPTAGNSFATIDCPSGTDPVADSTSDTLTLLAGTGITITGDSAADSVTIANTASVATDAIFDAKGDLAAGTGANTATKLTVGANDYFLVPDSSVANGLKWVTPSATRTILGLNTGDSPIFATPSVTSINVGSTSTTLTESSAGNLAIEGNLVYRAGGTDVPLTDGGTGSSTAAAARIALGVPRTLFDHYADETTPSTAADTLYTDTIAAATLTTNGDKLVGCYSGSSLSNANEKILDITWGGTGIWGGTFEVNLAEWHIDFVIIRVSNTAIRCSTRWTAGVGTYYSEVNYIELTGLNLTTNGYALALNAETTVSAGDVTARLGYCQYIPAYA